MGAVIDITMWRIDLIFNKLNTTNLADTDFDFRKNSNHGFKVNTKAMWS